MSTYRAQMNAVHRRAERAFARIADDFRKRVLISFCERRQLRFISGMGTWCFYDRRDRQYSLRDGLDRRRGWVRIVRVLELEIDRNNTLGASYVCDYTPKNWRQR